MDQRESFELMKLRCILEGHFDTMSFVGKHWLLSTFKQDISTIVGKAPRNGDCTNYRYKKTYGHFY